MFTTEELEKIHKQYYHEPLTRLLDIDYARKKVFIVGLNGKRTSLKRSYSEPYLYYASLRANGYTHYKALSFIRKNFKDFSVQSQWRPLYELECIINLIVCDAIEKARRQQATQHKR